jgi:hypothetical protein
MKKIILLATAVMVFSAAPKAQYTTADVFKTEYITFYGLDFSNIRLIGTDGFSNPYVIKTQLFDSWNNLFLSESDKYDIAKTFYKSGVKTSLDLVSERNTMPDPLELVINKDYSFGEDKVRAIIREYDTGVDEGIGLVFIMESFDKRAEMGYFWVTFFDQSNNEVLFAKHVGGKAGGFGIRNYWAKSYYNVMKDIGKKLWNEWSKAY